MTTGLGVLKALLCYKYVEYKYVLFYIALIIEYILRQKHFGKFNFSLSHWYPS